MRKRLLKKGQSALEYAVLIVVIIAALIAMQVYLKRGVQGGLREKTDQIGEQFSPGYTVGNYTTNTSSVSTEQVSNQDTLVTITTQTQNRAGSENVEAFGNEYWGV